MIEELLAGFTAKISVELIIANIAILLVVRNLEKNGYLKFLFKKPLAKGFYILAVVFLGLVGGFVKHLIGEARAGVGITGYTALESLYYGFLNAAASSMIYQMGKVALPTEKDFTIFKEEDTTTGGKNGG